MKLIELYLACANVCDYEDVVVHDGGRKVRLSDIFPNGDLLDRQVCIFSVEIGNELHVYMSKRKEAEDNVN